MHDILMYMNYKVSYMLDDTIYTGYEWNKHKLTDITALAISNNAEDTINIKKRVHYKVVLTSKCKHELWNLMLKLSYMFSY